MVITTLMLFWNWPPADVENPGGFAALVVGTTALLSWGAYIFLVRMFLPDMMTLSHAGLWCRVGGRIRQWSWPDIEDAKVGMAMGRGSPPVVLLLRKNEHGFSPQVSLGNMWKPLSSRGTPERDVAEMISAVLAQRNGVQPMTAQPSG